MERPNGTYHANSRILSVVYRPFSQSFFKKEIPDRVEKLKKLLQYFKGEHTIHISRSKLVDCEPFKTEWTKQERDWKIISRKDKTINVKVDKPKVAKLYIEKGSSFDDKGYFLEARFDVEGIPKFGFGYIFSSHKDAVDHWNDLVKTKSTYNNESREEIKHWELVITKKKRKVKCNECGEMIDNLTAQQCPKCGRYFCNDCFTGYNCSDCEGYD